MPVIRLKDIHRARKWNKHDINRRWDNIVKSGMLIDGTIRLGPFDDIVDWWKNKPVYVIGGSPAGRGLDLNLLNDKNTITMNHMIEVWDKSKWFIFMDRRFLRIANYDLKNYKGKIFAHVNTQLNKIDKDPNVVLFHTQAEKHTPTMDINKGLYCRSMTGSVALHLAILSGGNPIYLIGMDTSKNHNIEDGLHYNKGYTGEAKNRQKSMEGYISRYEMFKKFLPWKNRIINVCPDGYMDWFKRIDMDEFKKHLKEGGK